MNTNQIIVILGLIVAIVMALALDAFGQYALVLVALGLINGFMNPMADMAYRMAYTIASCDARSCQPRCYSDGWRADQRDYRQHHGDGCRHGCSQFLDGFERSGDAVR